jgi:uncharacterized membrane protein YeiH
MIYLLSLLGVAVFAVTGVLAAGKRDMDIFSIVLIGVVTALGGGTLRDLVLDTNPIFWIGDFSYLWAAVAASLATFVAVRFVRLPAKLLLFADACGLSLFTVLATESTLALGFPAPVAVIMGVVTGIVGGMIRDIITGKMPLVMGREFYATPSLLGAVLFVILARYSPWHQADTLLACGFCLAFRSAAIHWGLYYPKLLTFQQKQP